MTRTSHIFVVLAFAIAFVNYAFAQEAIVKKDANLRVDPSTNEPPEAKVHQGDRLTLLWTQRRSTATTKSRPATGRTDGYSRKASA